MVPTREIAWRRRVPPAQQVDIKKVVHALTSVEGRVAMLEAWAFGGPGRQPEKLKAWLAEREAQWDAEPTKAGG